MFHSDNIVPNDLQKERAHCDLVQETARTVAESVKGNHVTSENMASAATDKSIRYENR
jgi:hypothetical protein